MGGRPTMAERIRNPLYLQRCFPTTSTRQEILIPLDSEQRYQYKLKTVEKFNKRSWRIKNMQSPGASAAKSTERKKPATFVGS